MKVTQERIDQIRNDRNLHMLIDHTVVLATALKNVQERLERIEKHMNLSQGETESAK